MAKRKIKLLSTVALNEDLPGRKLKRGEVGTVVEVLAPDVYEVEFCDEDGQTYAELALRGDQLIPLHNQGDPLRSLHDRSRRSGVSQRDIFRGAATFVDKILNDAKPADLPVEQPMKFEFVINLKSAKQIGLTIPPNVLARADRVIR